MSEVESIVEYRYVKGFPDHRVGNDGTVWSRHRSKGWKLMKPTPAGSWGYPRVVLSPGQKSKLVHRLVLEAFVGPCPDGLQACHGDGDKCNNRLSNLRWDTPKANMDDMKRHGTYRHGPTHHRATAKVTPRTVSRMRADHRAGKVSANTLAARHHLSTSAVYLILSRKTWPHVD